LRRALYRRCVDLVRRQNAPPQPPPQLPPSEVEPSPDPDLLLRIVNDAVALWSTERFALARERLLSTALFRQTVIDLVEIAAGRRSVPEVLGADVAGLVSTQIWDAFKRRCQRTVRALVLLVPAVAVARGWADPSLAHVPLRTLKDFAVVVEDENTAPALRELVRALVAVATCYQRALARSQTQES
jgi:hypothetical protein